MESSRHIQHQQPHPHSRSFDDAVASLLAAQSEAEECEACEALLRGVRGNPSDNLVLLLASKPSASSRRALDDNLPPPIFSTMLEEFLLYFVMRAFSKAELRVSAAVKCDEESLAALSHWSCFGAHGEELGEYLQNLQGALLQCEWSAEALNGLCRVVALLDEPCLRQSALKFCFKLLLNILEKSSVASAKSAPEGSADNSDISDMAEIHQACTEIMLLGLTDVWSAIRKECAKSAANLVFKLPTTKGIDLFVDRLLRIAAGSEHINQDKSHQTVWGEREGALHALSLILSSIQVNKRAATQELAAEKKSNAVPVSSVAGDIKGGFGGSEPMVTYQFGGRHTSVTRLPRSLVQSSKPVLYQCLRHDQISVRENAAQCLKYYVDLCEEPMRLLVFQEVMSKLNRLKESTSQDETSDGGQELLETYEAEGLLDVLGKLAPSLPSLFLLKHWRFIFPTLEKYVMHIASSVRQKSSAVVLSLAKLSQSQSGGGNQRSCDAALELLMEMLLALSDHPRDETSFCWQQKEGRLLSIDLLVELLGKDLLFAKCGTLLLNSTAQCHESRRESGVSSSNEGLWTTATSSSATWTVDDEDMLDLDAASGRSEHANTKRRNATPLVGLLSELAEKKTKEKQKRETSDFWQRVLSGWLCQTRLSFASNQFELRRISRQVLPGLLRLGLWVNQLELLRCEAIDSEHLDDSWRWSCLKFILLHLRFQQESAETNRVLGADASIRQATRIGLQSARNSLLALMDSDNSAAHAVMEDTETTIVKVEVQLMGFLIFGQSVGKADLAMRLLEAGLSVVHSNLPPHMQLVRHRVTKRTNDSSLDRQLSIALVRMMPSIVTTFRLLVTSLPAAADQASDECVGNGSEKWRSWWLILERAALTWLTTDDMFRWITVDQREAHLLLLTTVDSLLQFLPQSVDTAFVDTEFELILNAMETVVSSGSNQSRFRESTIMHALDIYLSMWRVANAHGAPISRISRDVGSVYTQLSGLARSSAGKNTASQKETSVWDDWDQDSDAETDGTESSKKSELRLTATAHGHLPHLSAADQVLLRALTMWEFDELTCIYESLSSLHLADGSHEKARPHVSELLAVIDQAKLSKQRDVAILR